MTDLDPKALEAAVRSLMPQDWHWLQREANEEDFQRVVGDAIRAYLAALWLPIAEHDGSGDAVLVAVKMPDRWLVGEANWMPGAWWWAGHEMPVQPTHWMPLPQGPEEVK